MTAWTREMATELAREQWRDGWLEGRAMSLRLLRQEVRYMPTSTREAVLALADAMMAGVAQDREKQVQTNE
jgi:hypothetical protein